MGLGYLSSFFLLPFFFLDEVSCFFYLFLSVRSFVCCVSYDQFEISIIVLHLSKISLDCVEGSLL